MLEEVLPVRPPHDRTENISVINLVLLVHEKIDAIDAKLAQHKLDLSGSLTHLLADAFPGGDAAGHRRVHEADIARCEARAAFWEKMRFELTRWGLFGFLAWAGYYLWKAFLKGPQ